MKVVVNINETVRFKLTEHGKEVYRAQFDELNELLKSKRAPLCPRPEPDTDAEGYTKMQLWNFMEVFGPHTGMGLKPCIEPLEIVVDVESYKEVRYCRFSLEEARRRESVYKCSACGNYLTVRSDTLNGGRGDLSYCPFCGGKVKHGGKDE